MKGKIQITSVDIIVLVMISIIFIIGYLLYNTIVQEDDTIATGLFMMCIIGGLGGLGLWLIGKFVYSDNEDETCKQGIEL